MEIREWGDRGSARWGRDRVIDVVAAVVANRGGHRKGGDQSQIPQSRQEGLGRRH